MPSVLIILVACHAPSEKHWVRNCVRSFHIVPHLSFTYHFLNHGFPSRGPPAFMWSAATFVNCVYSIKIAPQFRHLCIPRTGIFPRAVRKRACNNRCGPLPLKVATKVAYASNLHYMTYVFKTNCWINPNLIYQFFGGFGSRQLQFNAGKAVLVHNVNAYAGVETWVQSFLTSVLKGSGWSDSHTGPFSPEERAPSAH